MIKISDDEFGQLMERGLQAIPEIYKQRLQNVAFLVEDDPSPVQRQQLKLRDDQTLFGLYEGVPLPRRNGALKVLPDKITLFKNPLERASHSLDDLAEKIRHTIWHEVAHYFGLDHERIHQLDGTEPS